MKDNEIHENKSKFFTRGGQITFHNWRMLLQINSEILKIYFLSLIGLTAVLIYVISPKEVLEATYYYWYSKAQVFLYKIHLPIKPFHVSYHGKEYIENGISFLSQQLFINQYKEIYGYVMISFLIAFELMQFSVEIFSNGFFMITLPFQKFELGKRFLNQYF